MDVTYPPEAEAFRVHVRGVLQEHLPANWNGTGALADDERRQFVASWRKTLAAEGLLAVSWPKAYGGAGLTEIEQVVLAEEFARHGAPAGTENDTFGIRLLGNTLIALASEETKAHFLPRILSGDDVWCQGFSEPDAGSDLAALRTRAELVDGHWVINGQKIWTSAAAEANWIFILARTDPAAPKHRGISFLLVPMDQPSVEVRPIRNAAGYEGFSEVFFTDARTRCEHVVGDVNDGWRVAMTLLGFERGSKVTTDAIRYRRELDRLVELARERACDSDPAIRDELAWCHSRVELMRLRGYRALTRFLRGERPGPEAAISKVVWSEYLQRYSSLAMQILGAEILAPTGQGNDGALQVAEAGTENSSQCWVDVYLHARAATIYAGSSQIQRNVIGERLLGLPKEPRVLAHGRDAG